MEKGLTPSEERAEALTQRVQRLKSAATTEEMLEAADSVKKVAKRVIEGDQKFLVKVKEGLDKAKN
jgi:hypothetical protein